MVATAAYAALSVYDIRDSSDAAPVGAGLPDAPAWAVSSGDPSAPPAADLLVEDRGTLPRYRIDVLPNEGYNQLREDLVEVGILAYSGGFFTPEVMKEEYSKIMSVLPDAFMEVDTSIHDRYAQHLADRSSDNLIESSISSGIGKLEFFVHVFNALKQPGVMESPTKMMHDYMEMTIESHRELLTKAGNTTDADREHISQVRWTGSVLKYFIDKEVQAWNNGEAVQPAAWNERHEQYTMYVAERIVHWNEKISDSIDRYNDREYSSRLYMVTQGDVQHMESVYAASAAAVVPEHAAPSWEEFRNATGQLIERNKEISSWVDSGNESALAHAEEITRELVRGGYGKYWSMPLPIPMHPTGEPYAIRHDTVIHLLEDSHSTEHGMCEKCFDKVSVVAVRGLNVTWSNDSPVLHGFESGTYSEKDGAFSTGVIMPGETYSLDTGELDAGHYAYHCIFHPWEAGLLEVREP
ncbi:hypothetical protein CENSYa_1472 [Cenarchaeum symbiosum A]|uniref:Blue (type 1) copper domain-containing protein n=1 Tax=Cenarchaeum symbiosum (strain A) TaxID=414004 RepID=A0RXM7_CENSY|nr:hypothetical protein CENSYa_1472 [Cenarchaeum symbiosum A]